jgi:tRNA (guanine37-N1)-methyltransferase
MKLHFKVLTLLPDFYASYFSDGVVSRALRNGTIGFTCHDLRDHSPRPDRRVDDRPFGGGDGMVIRADIANDALNKIKTVDSHVVFVNPGGKVLCAARAQALSQKREIILVCGRYDGFDRRVIDKHADEEISIGDYVLSGGDLAALVIMDTVSRFVPGVLGNPESPVHDSFSNGLLEGPLYTRPDVFDGIPVPPVLLSGDHNSIARQRRKWQITETARKRPDLILTNWDNLSKSEQKVAEGIWKRGV